METNLQPRASPWQPSGNSQMNVTAMPYRPPPFSLSHPQDPLAMASGLVHQHGSPSGGLGTIGSHGASPNPNTHSHLGPPPSLSLHGHPSTPMGPMINPVTGQGMVGLGTFTSHHPHGGVGMMSSSGGVPGANNSLSGAPSTGGAGGKYKTELCRSWEATGQCSYQGCTFAHGHEDLRGTPVAGPPQVMVMVPPPHSHSATNTPQQHTYSFNSNVVNANAAVMNSGLPPVASGRSSTMGTPVTGTYRIGGGVGLLGPGGLGTGLSAPMGSNSPLPAAPAPIQAAVPQPISTTAPVSAAEALMEVIMLEVRAERDKLFSQQTLNRQLEQQLKREQLMRQRNINNTALVTNMIASVEEAIRRRHAALTDIKRACGEDAMEAVVDAMIDGENF